MSVDQESRDKAVALALTMWRLAEMRGDELRVDLARATLAHVGYPGGEGAPTIKQAMAAIEARDGARS